jgi:hypothetical protein
MPVNREELLRAFTQSKERGTATGLRIQGRTSLLITTIEELVDLPDISYIVVNSVSIYGESLPRTKLLMNEIEHIHCLRIHFDDPFYVRLRAVRRNVQNLRYNSGDGRISLA